MNSIKSSNGFTLIEIIITIAILGILSVSGISAFDAQKRKGYRTDAIRSVSVMAQKMENWRASAGAYTNNINNVGTAASAEGKYTLSLSNVTTETYTITATATGPQAQDENCYKFILEHTSRRTAEKFDATPNTKCWPK